MNKVDSIILNILFRIPAVVLCGYFLWCMFTGKSIEELKSEDDLKEAFKGTVDTLFHEKQNHNIKVALLRSGYRYEILPNWERFIEVGDSLVKLQNELIVRVFKKNGGDTLSLNYQDTYKNQ
ncbi:hypothetical protein [Desertivirga brevis]|uniref:hypothetical protein n=1 Tax=Desertivirga brevis TaxID=2810310 RepID=UPI001A9785F9|nr:hypothetical protein [Pedobacter sp. SYSU D00873]